MKIKINADLMDSNMKSKKMIGAIVTVKKIKYQPKKILGYYFDFKGTEIFIPKRFVTEVK
jgi:hypothetical protein